MNKKAYLVFEDGTVFEGYSFGAECDAIGETVFNTSCVGYIETLTDECYFGQIVVETFPLIGNYGIIEEDFAGRPVLSGFVVREYCDTPSNFRCDYSLDEYLKKNGIPAIYGVDTRAVTRHIREKGAMNAVICAEIPSDLRAVKEYKIQDAAQKLGCDAQEIKCDDARFNVTVINCGALHNVVQQLASRGCNVKVVPFDTSAEQILADKPDGVVISDGAGDPAQNSELIGQISLLFNKLPILGIGLGHQLLALSQGAKSFKLKYGHRGGSQPVKDLEGSRTYITVQNHGYAVENTVGSVNLVNVNDNTCEGIVYSDNMAFSVQFVPEVSKGPHDTSFIYDRFIKLMGGN